MQIPGPVGPVGPPMVLGPGGPPGGLPGPPVPGAIPTGQVEGGQLKWDPVGRKYFRTAGKVFAFILKSYLNVHCLYRIKIS